MTDSEAAALLNVRLPVTGTELQYNYTRLVQEVHSQRERSLINLGEMQQRLESLSQAYQTLGTTLSSNAATLGEYVQDSSGSAIPHIQTSNDNQHPSLEDLLPSYSKPESITSTRTPSKQRGLTIRGSESIADRYEQALNKEHRQLYGTSVRSNALSGKPVKKRIRTPFLQITSRTNDEGSTESVWMKHYYEIARWLKRHAMIVRYVIFIGSIFIMFRLFSGDMFFVLLMLVLLALAYSLYRLFHFPHS